MAKINSRAKGKRGELELASILRDEGYSEVRRSQQFAGINGDSDLIGLPHIHIEVKRVESLNIEKAMKQARDDSHKTGDIPTVFHRKNGDGWKVTMDFKDWIQLYREWEAGKYLEGKQ